MTPSSSVSPVADDHDDGHMSDTSAVVRGSALTAAGTLLSRVTGVLRVVALALALGQTPLSDLFGAANIVPNLVYELVLGGVLSSTLVPLFVGDRRAADGGPSSDATSALISVGLLAGLLLSLLAMGGVAAVAFAMGVPDGLAPEDVGPIVTFVLLTQLALPQVFFYSLMTMTSAALNARKIYGPPAFVPVLNNLVSTAAFVAVAFLIGGRGSVLDIDVTNNAVIALLGLGATAGVAAMSLALIPRLRRELPELRFTPDLRHPAVRQLLRLSGWTAGYVVANQIALAVVYALAVSHGAGTLTSYQQAMIFFQLPHGLFAVSIMTTVGTELADAHAAGSPLRLSREYFSGLRLLAAVVIPAAVGLAAVAAPLIDVVLNHGAFDFSASSRTSWTLVAFASGLPAFSGYLYTLRAFYARQDTRTPFRINCVENGANIVLAIVLRPLGAPGLALAFSLAYLVGFAVAVTSLRAELEGFEHVEVRRTTRLAGKIAIASAAMGVAAGSVQAAPWPSLARLALGVTVGSIVLAVCARFLDIDELTRIVTALVPRSLRGVLGHQSATDQGTAAPATSSPESVSAQASAEPASRRQPPQAPRSRRRPVDDGDR